MFNQKSKFKKLVMAEYWAKVWGCEVNEAIHLNTLERMKEARAKIEAGKKLEQDFLDELPESTKYEDRQKRQRAEKEIETFDKKLAEQDTEIKNTENKIADLQDKRQKLEEAIIAIKDKFN